MRIALAFVLFVLFVLLAACGGGGQSPPDAPPVDMSPPIDRVEPPPPPNPGFVPPVAALRANVEVSPDVWMDVGPADLSCLGTPDDTAPTTVAVALATTVVDFQTDNLVPDATIDVFPDEDLASPFAGSPFTADVNGTFAVNLPIGTRRFGFDIRSDDALRTLVLREVANPGQATQTATIRSFSKTTAATLPALIGVSRTPGTALALGVARDCQGREMSNFIATVSATTGVPAHVAGADTYYFSSAVGLPVRHNNQGASSEDGRFMVIELGPIANAFVQIWGFRNDRELAANELTLVAELAVPLFEDSVIAPSLEPLRL